MKLILEDTMSEDITITIQGNLADKQVQNIITLLKSTTISNRIIAFDEDKEVLLNIADVSCFLVENRKLYAIASSKKYVVRYTLSEISTLFKGQGIIQIGKSLLVNIHKVKSLEAEFSGNYVITLVDQTQLVASRLYMKEFRKAIMKL